MDLLAAVDYLEPQPDLLRMLVRAEDDMESCGVHELDASEVEDHVLRTRLPRAPEFRLEGWCRGEVNLSAWCHDRGSVVAVDVYGELSLHV